MKLTPTKRDELLIRMDERQRQIKDEDLPEIKEHLRKINGHLENHSGRLTIVETQVNERTESPVAKRMSKKVIAGYGSGGLLVIALTVLQIIQMFGG